ncbi:hypothetical protein, partial [Azospirillum argentinense]
MAGEQKVRLKVKRWIRKLSVIYTHSIQYHRTAVDASTFTGENKMPDILIDLEGNIHDPLVLGQEDIVGQIL